MTVKTKRTRKKSTEVGRSVIRSLKEIRAWQRGEIELNVTEILSPIPPTRIKAIRKKAARSVRVFSERFGLPAKTVQLMGARSTASRRRQFALLEVIDANPDVVAAAARRRTRAA